MSDDDFSTRKVAADEMDRLRDLLEKVEKIPSVEITITTDLYARVDAVLDLCDISAGNDEARFVQAVNQIFEAGLREYEARQAMDE